MGCLPLCPQELSLPTLGCANPRLVKVPGQCCEEWVCDDGKQRASEKLFGSQQTVDDSENDLTNRNELISILRPLPGKSHLACLERSEQVRPGGVSNGALFIRSFPIGAGIQEVREVRGSDHILVAVL